jgi:hypothetical protein
MLCVALVEINSTIFTLELYTYFTHKIIRDTNQNYRFLNSSAFITKLFTMSVHITYVVMYF